MTGSEQGPRRPANFAAALKDVKSLQTDRGFRDTHELFFIEGVRNFVRLVDNGVTIECIIFSERLLTAPLARKLVRRCRRAGVHALSVTPERFRKLPFTRRASGVAAIVRQRWASLNDVSPEQGLCWVLLETIRSPGNLGTLIRSSAAVGGAGFIFTGNSADPYDPAVVRAAMGAVYRQKFIRTDCLALGAWIDQHKCEVIGAAPAGTADLHHFDIPKAPLIVLGEERQGLTSQQRRLCSNFVRIPMQDGVDSLNLGVAGSLLMYEVYRKAQPS